MKNSAKAHPVDDLIMENDLDIVISLEPGVVAGPHDHWRTTATIDGKVHPFIVGKYNAFIPFYDASWGLKIFRNWPTEMDESGKVFILNEGLMPDPAIASENLRLKALELIDLQNLLHGYGLAPEADPRPLSIRFDTDSYETYKHMLQSQRWRGGDAFWGIRVRTLKMGRPWLIELRPGFRKFRRGLEAACVKESIRRRLSTSRAFQEFMKIGNYGYVAFEGYKLIDIDLANSFGRRILSSEKIASYVADHAQFPQQKKDMAYQSFEIDGQVFQGGRSQALERLNGMGVDLSIFDGASVLDLGCNIGVFCFLAKELGARYTLGIDINDHAIEGAKMIRDHKGLTGMDFMQASLEDRRLLTRIRDVAGKETFDVVLAMSIVKHARQPNLFHYAVRKLTNANQEPFFRLVRRLTGKTLLFEGHGNETEDRYLEPLRHRFGKVEFKGHSKDHHVRPLFISEP